MKRHIRTAIAAALGLGPGVLLPFFIALSLESRQSDFTVLALSVSVVLINVVIASIESTAVASVGRALSGEGTSSTSLRKYALRNALRGFIAIGIGAAFMVLVFAGSVDDLPHFIVTTAIFTLGPVVGAYSATYAGMLIAAGQTFAPILTQGFRSITPILGLLIFPNLSSVWIAAFYVSGEVVRFMTLKRACRRIFVNVVNNCDLDSRGLVWQFASTSLTQANPVVDKFFLTDAPSGSITAYELADKVSFSVFQVAYNFGLLQRLGKWSTAPAGSKRRRLFYRDILALMGGTLFVATLGAVAIFGALNLGWVPESWSNGVKWGMIALFAMPFAIGVTSSMRYIVILDRTRWLLPISIGGVLLNAALDLLFLELFGPMGIIIASIPTRAFLFLGFQAVIFVLERRVGFVEK